VLRAATIPPIRTLVIGEIFRRMPSQLKPSAAPPNTATGAELPMAMFQSGRIRISGDLFFAAQLQGMFEIPTATRPAR
jgi:SCP-2 sterol transfer family